MSQKSFQNHKYYSGQNASFAFLCKNNLKEVWKLKVEIFMLLLQVKKILETKFCL